MSFFRVSIVSLLLLVQAPVLLAVSAGLVSYNDAVVVEESVDESTRSRVVLSAVTRVSNALRIEREKWIEGTRRSWLFKLNDAADNLLYGDFRAEVRNRDEYIRKRAVPPFCKRVDGDDVAYFAGFAKEIHSFKLVLI